MFNFFLSKIKEKKGLSSLETVIGCLIAIMCICFMIDLNKNMYKFSALSSTTTYIAKNVGVQGGISPTRPTGLRGEFISTGTMYNDIKSIMNNAGVEDSEFKVLVNGTPLYGNNKSSIKKIGDDISIEVSVDYDFSVSEQFIGLNSSFTKTNKRSVVSTFIPRENNLESLE